MSKAERPVKASVMMITFNHEPFIAQAIDSVLMQEVDFDYELVIGEDCSTDATRSIVTDYQARHPDKIRLLLPDRNLGMMRNFERTYGACRGQYLAILDGDDYWTSAGKLERQVKFLDGNTDFSLCFGRVNVEREGGANHGEWPPANTKDVSDLADLVEENFIPTCSVMYRRGLVPSFPEWMFSLDMGDWPLHILHAQHGKIGYLRETMAVYREHRGGTWSSRGTAKKYCDLIKVYKCIDEYLGYRFSSRIRPKVDQLTRELSRLHGEAADPREAVKSARVPVSRNRRILIAVDYYWPSIGGLEVCSHGLARQLLKSGYEVDVATSPLVERRTFLHEGVRIIPLGGDPDPSSGIGQKMKSLRDLVSGGGYDACILMADPLNWIFWSIEGIGTPLLDETAPAAPHQRGWLQSVEKCRFFPVPFGEDLPRCGRGRRLVEGGSRNTLLQPGGDPDFLHTERNRSTTSVDRLPEEIRDSSTDRPSPPCGKSVAREESRRADRRAAQHGRRLAVDHDRAPVRGFRLHYRRSKGRCDGIEDPPYPRIAARGDFGGDGGRGCGAAPFPRRGLAGHDSGSDEPWETVACASDLWGRNGSRRWNREGVGPIPRCPVHPSG